MAENDTRDARRGQQGFASGRNRRRAGQSGAELRSGVQETADDRVDSSESAQSATPGTKAQRPKTQRAHELLPSVSLPKGGAAIRGLGEKFSVNPSTGTGSLSLPLPLSKARFTPPLQLSYDSGNGNGPFGFGWSLNAATITRKTDKGLPRYDDGADSDVFILAGAEDLVPVLDASGNPKQLARSVHGTAYQIHFYRPRIEGPFSRIERWLALDSGISHWRTIDRDNQTTLYGFDALSRIANSADARQVFSWRISRTWDSKGNFILYNYLREDGSGIPNGAVHEINRTPAQRAAQTYLASIQYGNLEPYVPDWSSTGSEPAVPKDWAFSVVFDFGDHSPSNPLLASDRPWALRPDPFSSYRAGFEIRTYRRVERLLFFNNFPAEPTAGANSLVRSLDLLYSDQQSPMDPRNPVYTFLVSATKTGYGQGTSGVFKRSLPPLEFTYSTPQLSSDVLRLDRDSLGNLPEGIDGERIRWVDLDGEGLSGMLADTGCSWLYKRNLSANNQVQQPDKTLATRARFGALETVAGMSSTSALSPAQRLLDLAGAGQLDVVTLAGPTPGFFKRTADFLEVEDATFEPFHSIASLPVIDWDDPNVKLIDLTGDGLADVLVTEDGLFTFYPSLGEEGFDAAERVRTPGNEELGPKIVLADGSQTIFLADMTGDGLSDLVRVRNGETCYWPNIGYGRFGAKVSMGGAPRFDSQDRFDPARIRLADVDGTGTADLLYVGSDGVRAWFNQSGNAWSEPNTIAAFPTRDKLSSVQVLDLLGTGTACLVWSSPLPAESTAPLLYVDLMDGQKPHLLVQVRNNLGAETRITYAPSTRFYLADEQAGQPWITRLPFPVQVVERQETIDWIGRNRLVNRFAYHHGHFDGYEREFRGFGMVEQWDTEEFRADTNFNDGDFVNWDQQSWVPPTLTRSWFHTGAFVNALSVSQSYVEEYWTEPALRPPARAADAAAMRIPDTVLPSGLNALEVQEAYRALKGQMLRQEIYAEDGTPQAANPYVVTEQNFTLLCLQRMGPNLHAVFFVPPRERISFQYERGIDDPRVTHEITLESDAYGNPLRSASIGYPRRAGYAPPEPSLTATTQSMLAYDQTRLHVDANALQYTNAIDAPTTPDDYRVPLPASTTAAELTGLTPSVKGSGITNLFAFDEIDALWKTAWTGANDIVFEAVPASDVNGSGTLPSVLTRRLTAQSRTLYRTDDLTSLLSLGQLQPRALTGESYQQALTPGQITAIYGALVTTAILGEGGYVQLPSETGWWMPSGRVYLSAGDSDTAAQELSAAQANFFLPRRAVDPFGAISRVTYDAYNLLPATFSDAVGNITSTVNDYRALQPRLVTDPNSNQTQVAFDLLGLVAGTAVMGKVSEHIGDSLTGFVPDLDDPTIVAHMQNPLVAPDAILGNATTRVIYDIAAYYRTGTAPPAVYTLARETNVSDLNGRTTLYQHKFAYSDGFGRVIQSKGQSAPETPGSTPRWIGSGWTIFDNKGKSVRQYEPFFSPTNAFEFAAINGVSSVLLYDPPGRVVAKLHPDNTWEKTVFDAWRQELWDGNDTVLFSDPRTDPDVGDHFVRMLGTLLFQSWHDLRITGTYGTTPDDQAAQKDAAAKTEAHFKTPNVGHFDALGHTCLQVLDDGSGQRYPSRVALDSESHTLAVFDALGRRVIENVLRLSPSGTSYIAGSDMGGNPLYSIGMDNGQRKGLANVVGNPIRHWDARGNAFRMLYDPQQRLTHRYVSASSTPEILIERLVYGEQLAANNLCGRLFRQYDTAGVLINEQFDYKGNLVSSARQLALQCHQSVDWAALANLTTAAALDAASAPLLVAADRFEASSVFDALNRAIQVVTPHSTAMKPNVLQPSFNEASQIDRIDIWLQQAAVPTGLLDPTTAGLHAITAIDYNARGQRIDITLGNQTGTTYTYDPQTFRLTSLVTARPNTFAVNQQTVQDLSYYYDPVGNITRIRDTADTQDVIYFNNQRVDPTSDYTYDPLYRLIQAKGREHLGQNGGVLNAPQQGTNDDSFCTRLPQPGDGKAMGNYTETYTYDPVGNFLTMVHQVSSGNWTRFYTYTEPSQIVTSPAETCNRLSTTSMPSDPSGGPYTATYSYDADGNMTRMPHLPALVWDENDRLRSTTRQVVNSGTPVTTFYVYDAAGQRVRKTTDGQAATSVTPPRQAERIYLGAVEIYREFAADGVTVTLQRETLHIMDETSRVVVVETRTAGSDAGLAQLIRYQFTNHLDSAALELDDLSQIISYEEYFPFGSTSYQAVRNQTDTPKRYRYTGKERDNENDLYYNGARYYAAWLGRWTSCDPKGIDEGPSAYWYARDNPITLIDRRGMDTTTTEVSPEEQARREQFRKENIQKLGVALDEAIAARKEVTKLQHLGASDMFQYMKEPNLEKAEELRLSLISMYENFEHQAKVKAFTYALLAEVNPPPPPPPPPPERVVEYDVQKKGSSGVHPEVQALYTYNESPNNLPGYSSIDVQVVLPLKDYSGIKINLIKDKLTLSFLHEPALGAILSTHIKDPSDNSAASVHTQPLVQVDVLHLDIDLPKIPEIELKGTLVGLYDVYSGSGQVQAQGTVQVHLKGPASLVFQGTVPIDSPGKSLSGGVEFDF
jgi:RHS repeat-associated protein